ncbi:hypothetical protein [Streptomyces sp. NPDC006368]|uniref:GNAT family N-acetyltransferase n=1 Tax=Streptomyces sp. NPDC006368 TaxID=3156760 RepID=UPI0033A75C3D
MTADIVSRPAEPFRNPGDNNPAYMTTIAGHGVGAAGLAEPGEAVRGCAGDASVERAVARILAGLTCVAAAVEDGSALCAGQHQPVGAVTEIVGVGTLPTARRRGLAHAVTAVLVADARSQSARPSSWRG